MKLRILTCSAPHKILQVYSFPDQLLIFFLNARSVCSFLILSSRVFQTKLPLKDSDSSQKLVLLILGNLQKFSALRLYPTCFLS